MQPIAKLQQWLVDQALDGFLLTHTDHHLNEYVPPAGERVRFLTGFRGSTSLFLLTQNRALLFVDGRYTLQARQEVAGGIEVCSWTLEELKNQIQALGSSPKIAYDAWLVSVQTRNLWKQNLDVELMSLDVNPVDHMWQERPEWPENPAWSLDNHYAGEAAQSKLSRLQEWLQIQDLEGTFLSDLMSIAWLMNLRGHDLQHTPVASAWAFIPAVGKATLFLKNYDEPLRSSLNHVNIQAYENFRGFLEGLSPQRLLLDPEYTPQAVFDLLQDRHDITLAPHFCIDEKARKNAVEIAGFRQAHLYDGIAVCEAFAELEELWSQGIFLTEYEFGDMLTDYRRKQPQNLGTSFDPIVGFRHNGAIVHYHAQEGTCLRIAEDGLLLVDSGGQYLCGTTDITRTIALGEPSTQAKQDYTCVLKGHIAIAQARFPKNASQVGVVLDGYARKALWEKGLDYSHGTGHGVGHCLNVHEGPYSLSPRASRLPLPLGSVLSNEPGVYREGQYGIRIESLVVVIESSLQGFYEFETLTCVPLDTNLIHAEALSTDERRWLNDYHQSVYDRLHAHVSVRGKAWLQKATRAI